MWGRGKGSEAECGGGERGVRLQEGGGKGEAKLQQPHSVLGLVFKQPKETPNPLYQ